MEEGGFETPPVSRGGLEKLPILLRRKAEGGFSISLQFCKFKDNCSSDLIRPCKKPYKGSFKMHYKALHSALKGL